MADEPSFLDKQRAARPWFDHLMRAAQRYQQQAESCRKQSETVDDPHSRSVFLRLATLYQDMADQFRAKSCP